jgi:protein-S-isoprenylcysteine O-methyltransferase Ste14
LLIFWAVLAGQLTGRKQVSGLGNFWVDKGPYEILRHPIYAGVFLIMSSFVQWQFTLPRLFVFVLFIGVCLIKMKSDEQILVEHFKEEYKHYQERTHKIIPYFY